ncbi:MAG: condensation domain-containing protein, partial [Thermoanaerobaculia bacterium]
MSGQTATAASLLADLRRQGVMVWAEEDRLRLNAPKGVLTPDLQALLGDHKPELLALLRPAEDPPPLAKTAADAAPSDEAPLSFTQERLWFLDRLEPGSPVYNIPMAVRVGGVLDRSLLAASLRKLVQRHAILRTTCGLRDGQPVQRVAADATVDLAVVDLSGLDQHRAAAEARRRMAAEERQPFDLRRGPLLRTRLLEMPSQQQILLLTCHHFVADGWSIQVLFNDLG